MSLFDLSSEGADRFLILSNVFLVLGLVLGLLGTLGSMKASTIRDRYADIRQGETDARAAEAILAAAQANERSANLENHTAELHRQAEEAKAETARVNERLMKMQEGRRLKPEHKKTLSELFKSDIFHKEPRIRIMVASVSEVEANIYAQDFIDLFLAAGIRTNPNFGKPHPTPGTIGQRDDVPFDLALFINKIDFDNDRQEFGMLLHHLHEMGLETAIFCDEEIELNDSRLGILKKPRIA